jgi:hypothetical protein
MDVSDKVNLYISESAKAIAILSEKFAQRISDQDFLVALTMERGYSLADSTKIANDLLTAEQMVSLLQDYPFTFPIVLDTVTLKESILPNSVGKLLLENTVKQRGEIWLIRKCDPDPFPSKPHAHNQGTGAKLHLGNGQLFNSRNRPLGESIARKDLVAIRGKIIEGIDLPPLEI